MSRPLPPDLAALRAYVTAPGEAGGVTRAASTVVLHVRHASLKQRFAELRLDMHVRGERARRRGGGEGEGEAVFGFPVGTHALERPLTFPPPPTLPPPPCFR